MVRDGLKDVVVCVLVVVTVVVAVVAIVAVVVGTGCEVVVFNSSQNGRQI